MADETTTVTQTDTGLSPEADAQMKLRFQLLPEPLQKMITEGSYNGALITIAKKYKLTFEQLESLQLETVMALFGLSTLLDYRAVLADDFKKPDVEMDQMINDLNEQVFDKVKDSLQNFYATVEEAVNAPEEVVDESDASIADDSNPFDGSLNVAPAPVESAPNVVPIRTVPVAAVPVVPDMPTSRTPAMATQATLTPGETSVLGNAGVVLGESQNAVATPEDTAVLNRTDLMQGIENPVKTPTSTIVANKLSTSSTLMPNKTTDYTLPRTSQPAPATNVSPAKPGSDPYREIPQ